MPERLTEQEKAARRAQALRANLKRRKAATRRAKESPPPDRKPE
ncbi:hypothetical protein [Hyphomonas johnsonii]|nr:hypothetical protein [Hyphomonas johnsonii]